MSEATRAENVAPKPYDLEAHYQELEQKITAAGIPADLFAAAMAAGLSLFYLDTLPAPDRAERLSFDAAFFVPPRTGTLFALYLSLCQPHVDLIARYIHLSEE